MELPADTGLTLTAYSAEPGSPSEQALTFLASWASSPEQAALPQQQASEQRPAR
jgi:hypothetical protein